LVIATYWGSPLGLALAVLAGVFAGVLAEPPSLLRGVP